jgi:hypothetical protein
MNKKVIDEDWFRELIGELDLERAIGESITEGPATTQATTQDKDIGEASRRSRPRKNRRWRRRP